MIFSTHDSHPIQEYCILYIFNTDGDSRPFQYIANFNTKHFICTLASGVKLLAAGYALLYKEEVNLLQLMSLASEEVKPHIFPYKVDLTTLDDNEKLNLFILNQLEHRKALQDITMDIFMRIQMSETT